MAATVLLIEPDAPTARALGNILRERKTIARVVTTTEEALSELDFAPADLIVVGMGGDIDPAAALRPFLSVAPDVPVVALSDEPSLGVAAVRAGAADFLSRPPDQDEVAYVIGKALQQSELQAERPPPTVVASSTAIGNSPPMRDLLSRIQKAAQGVATVLVRGESGVGKELVARQVHELSPRASGPFVKVHCGALPDNLLESELFGYEKGAFTGATARKPGRVELAMGGTLFLDEIGDITPAIQVKLLRILQDREYERLGGTRTLSADVRFVAATHQDLEALVRSGSFRQDLFYRLNVVSLTVPPLRARDADIEQLALHFCATTSAANDRNPVTLDVDALEELRRHPWPGNVRELQNLIERLVVMAEAPRLTAADVRRELSRQEGGLRFLAADDTSAPLLSPESSIFDLASVLHKAERRAVEKALRKANGNRNVAARMLGISRRSLYYKLQEHGLS